MAGEGEKAHNAAPQINPYGRVDEEVAAVAQRDARRRKRIKCFAYIAAFVVFQAAVILIFGLTIMKFRTPRLRVRSAAFDGAFTVVESGATPSFEMRMVAELGVKNANFGRYKYQNGTVEFYYGATKVGEALIPRATAKARSTRKFNVTVDLSSANVPIGELTSQFGSTPGVIPLTSRATVRGKVEIMRIMKKNKSANMNCTMQIDVQSRQLRSFSCR
ncbi:hypothetical protein SASPL_107533 [Salvia splendens]|uniref:Late embryogenesis abundant protein LEA-2 subgroup domain-containing protein n=1 Tax=Salvia splendens TaxID=180675 RepID=A0A8X9A4I5_SALSN|nr:uncharacterized protein LOC121795487 [Salvia splendens]KAG6429482.1 hypothetical protein SASPL_107533 [Salvia splendens]